MNPEQFEVGSKVVLNRDHSVFQDTVFTVMHDEEGLVRVTFDLFGRTTEVEIDRSHLKLAPPDTNESK